MIRDLNPGPDGLYPEPDSLRRQLYFTADTPTGQRVSSGPTATRSASSTTSGPGASGSEPNDFAVPGSHLYFSATNPRVKPGTLGTGRW